MRYQHIPTNCGEEKNFKNEEKNNHKYSHAGRSSTANEVLLPPTFGWKLLAGGALAGGMVALGVLCPPAGGAAALTIGILAAATAVFKFMWILYYIANLPQTLTSFQWVINPTI